MQAGYQQRYSTLFAAMLQNKLHDLLPVSPKLKMAERIQP